MNENPNRDPPSPRLQQDNQKPDRRPGGRYDWNLRRENVNPRQSDENELDPRRPQQGHGTADQ